jgi:hypothetical protein
MRKCFKLVILTLVFVFTLQQAAFAGVGEKLPSKPTEGVESSDPNHGSSTDGNNTIKPNVNSLFFSYYCSIDNTGSDLYVEGSTVSLYLSDQVQFTLYLQKWDGSQWVDIKSWTFSKSNAKSITDGERTDYEHGNYYRARAVHYIKYGTQSETQNSTSPYIVIN